MVARTESDLLQFGNPLGHKTIHIRRKPRNLAPDDRHDHRRDSRRVRRLYYLEPLSESRALIHPPHASHRKKCSASGTRRLSRERWLERALTLGLSSTATAELAYLLPYEEQVVATFNEVSASLATADVKARLLETNDIQALPPKPSMRTDTPVVCTKNLSSGVVVMKSA